MAKLISNVSPHFSGKRTTQNIMLDVIIALCPAAVASVIIFGLKALIVIAVCVIIVIVSIIFFKKKKFF